MTTKQLKSSPFPTMLSDLAHSNQLLKMFSIMLLLLTLVSLFVIFYLLNKEPIVLTLTPEGKILEKTLMPKPETFIQEGIKRYIEKRYIWEPGDVLKKLNDSESFISPTSLKAFKDATINVSKFSIEKQVSQRIYPSRIEINLKDNVATISGDRLTTIQGLRAAGDLRLQLSFESGPRTNENPWGIYITKEKEEL